MNGVLANIVKGLGQAFPILSGIFGAITGERRDKRNYEHQKEVFEFQKGQAEQAMDLNKSAHELTQQSHQHQVDQMNWARDMHLQGWQREDNAVQRRVEDLKAAGLSPVLAAGSAASASGPINITSPHGAQGPGIPNATTSPRHEFSALDKAMIGLGLAQRAGEIDHTKAQTSLIELQQAKTRAETAGIQARTDIDRLTYSYDDITFEYRFEKFLNEVATSGLERTYADLRNELTALNIDNRYIDVLRNNLGSHKDFKELSILEQEVLIAQFAVQASIKDLSLQDLEIATNAHDLEVAQTSFLPTGASGSQAMQFSRVISRGLAQFITERQAAQARFNERYGRN